MTTSPQQSQLRPTTTPSGRKRASSDSGDDSQPVTKKIKTASSDESDDETTTPIRATHFGIELEFVLAFKEDLLDSTLSKYNIEAEIVKQLNDLQHKGILTGAMSIGNASYTCRSRYPSWGLLVPKHDTTREQGEDLHMSYTSLELPNRSTRRYVMEPLLIAKDCLQRHGLDANVIGWIGPARSLNAQEIPFPGQDKSIMIRNSEVDYTKWTLTNDTTLVGLLRSQLQDRLLEQGVALGDMERWDSYGLEMISPVFELKKQTEALETVGKYLNSLCGDDTSILESIWASTHVHVGFNFEKPEDMPMLLLQHLAYMLVLHEDLLSKCHPRSRCGVRLAKVEPLHTGPGSEDDEIFDPNAPYESPPGLSPEAVEQANEEGVLTFEATYTGVDDTPGAGNVESNARHLRKQLPEHSSQNQAQGIREIIFQDGGNIFDLAKHLQQKRDNSAELYRGYIYNFSNLYNLARSDPSGAPIKPTIEFRQHACTLDVKVLQHWVKLLEAIVRTAERKATQMTQYNSSRPLDQSQSFAEREGSKYPSSNRTASPWPYESMTEFCGALLELDEEEGRYWQERYDQYKDDRPESVEDWPDS